MTFLKPIYNIKKWSKNILCRNLWL